MSNSMNFFNPAKSRWETIDYPGDGGSAPPEVANAIETHGIGWTDGSSTTIEWDGDVGERTIVDMSYAQFVHVSDMVPTTEELSEGIVSAYYDGEITDYPFDSSLIIEDMGIIIIGAAEQEIAIVPSDGFEIESLAFPKAGIYFQYGADDQGTVFAYISKLTYGNEAVHQIDAKYLPSNGSKFVVTLTATDDGLSADKTFAEIKAAYDAGMSVVASMSDEGDFALAALTTIGEHAAAFTMPYVVGGDPIIASFHLFTNNGIDTWTAVPFIPTFEEWTFSLSDGTTVVKEVLVK